MDTITRRFIKKIKDIHLEIERIYLFGSQARGEGKPDSDYDLLIVSPHPDKDFRSRIYDVVVDILLETGRVISLKIFKTAEFERLCKMQTPFMQNVLKEGVKLG